MRLVALVSNAAGVVLLCVAAAALGQIYPAKPLRLVIPYPPGGGTDIIGRIVAQKLAENVGQQVLVDNRGGAGGTIGTEIVARSVPDGYTLLMVPTSHVINPSIYAKLPYDTVKDFAPITYAASATILLVVHPSVPAQSVKELIALARQRPRDIHFGSAGNGTVFHLTGELFKRQAGIDMVHVPFKGGGPTIASLVGGQVTVAFETMLALQPFVKAGKARAIAVTSAKRSSVLPNVPTTVEAGFPGIIAENWYGFYAPAATSKDIVTRLNSEIVKILRAPDIRERFNAQGAEIVASTPEQLAEFVRGEIAKWARTAREAGARVE
jgi:tripartite-type tricarboxylate transporter receptor subunit TctC